MLINSFVREHKILNTIKKIVIFAQIFIFLQEWEVCLQETDALQSCLFLILRTVSQSFIMREVCIREYR